MDLKNIISINPEICFGKPHIKGTRLKISFILELLSSGWSIEQIVSGYNHISENQVQACLTFASS